MLYKVQSVRQIKLPALLERISSGEYAVDHPWNRPLPSALRRESVGEFLWLVKNRVPLWPVYTLAVLGEGDRVSKPAVLTGLPLLLALAGNAAVGPEDLEIPLVSLVAENEGDAERCAQSIHDLFGC